MDISALPQAVQSTFAFVQQLLCEEEGYIECMTYASFVEYMARFTYAGEVGQGGEGTTMKFTTADASHPTNSVFTLKRYNIDACDKLGRIPQQQLQSKVKALKEVKSLALASKATPGSQLSVPYKVIIVPNSKTADQFMVVEVMEYAAGTTLTNFATTYYPQGMPEELVHSFIIRCLPGFLKMQLANVVHRDIKSCNFQVNSDGMVRLIDWGFAQQAGPQQHKQGLSITHIAPEALFAYVEQGADLSQPATQAADVYSFFVTMHYLLVGNDCHCKVGLEAKPTTLLDLYHVFKSTNNGLFFAGRTVSAWLTDLLTNCLCVDPDSRFNWDDVVRKVGSQRISQELQTCRTNPATNPILHADLQFLLDYCEALEDQSARDTGHGCSKATLHSHCTQQPAVPYAAAMSSLSHTSEATSASPSEQHSDLRPPVASGLNPRLASNSSPATPTEVTCSELNLEPASTASDASESDAEPGSTTPTSTMHTSRSWESDSSSSGSASATPRHQAEVQTFDLTAEAALDSHQAVAFLKDETVGKASKQSLVACDSTPSSSLAQPSVNSVELHCQDDSTSFLAQAQGSPGALPRSATKQGYVPTTSAETNTTGPCSPQHLNVPCQVAAAPSKLAGGRSHRRHRHRRQAGSFKRQADKASTTAQQPSSQLQGQFSYESVMPLALAAVNKALHGL